MGVWVVFGDRRPVVVGVVGLGRTFLEQHDRQQHEDRHLQEFALPVLAGGLPEVAMHEVTGSGRLRLAVPLTVVIADVHARGELSDPCQCKHQQENER
jgi:hypothetical protein